MVKVEMGEVKVQARPAGGFMVTLPVAIAKILQINGGEKLKVFFDVEQKEIVYKVELTIDKAKEKD